MSQITREQRHEIARILQSGFAKKVICIAIRKDKSVLSRELKRNSSKRVYSPVLTHEHANERKERFRRYRKFTEGVKAHIVSCLIEEPWSPEQIVGSENNGAILTATKRMTSFLLMKKPQKGKNTKAVESVK